MMTEKKWRRFIKKEIDKEMAEIEGILEEMNQNPETKDVVAPEEMHDKLFAHIREEEEKRNRLSEEEKELIQLGMVYKKRRKWNKYVVLVAAVIGGLAIGITSVGGPERIAEKFNWKIADREQTNIDTDDGRVEQDTEVSEMEAYQQIEDEFGFYPVKPDYFPEGIEFTGIDLDANTQSVFLSYEGKKQEAIVCVMCLNYRSGSIGKDAEDNVMEKKEKYIGEASIVIKKFLIEENNTVRYIAEFEYKDVYYVLQFNKIDEVEIEKILDNLHFR